MLKIKDLPKIELNGIGSEVDQLLKDSQIQFRSLHEAPGPLRWFSKIYNEPYLAYKNIIYVPEGHVEAAQSKEFNQRIIATSKLLPWIFAIKNGSVSSWYTFLSTMCSQIRNYYFLYEFALIKSHELPQDTSDLIAVGFISTRKNLFGIKRNPEKVLYNLKALLQSKVERLG